MPTAMITLQPERTLALAASAPFVQENMAAACVLPYQYIMPYIRVVRSSDNNLSTIGVSFQFMTAALLGAVDDESAKGPRFLNIGSAVAVGPVGATLSGASMNGFSTVGTVITNPGGLLLWSVTNTDNSRTNVLRFEINLICRGA